MAAVPIGLFPRVAPRPTTSSAELALHRALAAQLPEGWTAWHSLRIRTSRDWEGESDFVIAMPDVGVLVVEVKGGAVSLRDGRWFQNGRPMDRSPREQAHAFRKKLTAKLRERGITDPPFVTIVTAFPETAFERAPDVGDLDDAVLGQQDLPRLEAALLALRDRVAGLNRPPRAAGWEDALHALWGETWVPSVGFTARAEHRKAELVALGREQLGVLDLLEDSERLLVRGGPGTGKTLLAVEVARRWKRDGLSPVYLCFTRALARALVGQVERALSVRDFAAELVEGAGIAIQSGSPRASWSSETWEQLPLLAAEHWGASGSTATAVVVDEAQDFSPADWTLVRAIAGDRPLWAFGDDGQGFFGAPRGVQEELFVASARLRARYRCPEGIATFADLYRADAVEGPAASPADLHLVGVSDPDDVSAVVSAHVEALIGDGVRPQDIAVLSLAGQTRTEIGRRTELGGRPVARADEERAATHVVVDTFLRFKGLERPYVIVTELRRSDARYDVRMHIALTRATVGCLVIGSREELELDPRLAAPA